MTDLHATPDLARPPVSAWALAGLCLLGQLLALLERGFNGSDETWVLLSMVLSALVVGWVSAGVLRARTGRLVLVWILFGLGLAVGVFEAVVQMPELSGEAVLGIVVYLLQIFSLAAFCRSDFFDRQRTRPSPGEQPSIAGLVLVAVVVGGLGGLTAPAGGDNPPQQLRVGL